MKSRSRNLLIGAGVLTLLGGAGAIILAPISHPKLAHLVAPGVDYPLTWNDLLWLARASNCETQGGADGIHYEAVSWAMIQWFVARRQRGAPHTASLSECLRSFSSPVNPHFINGTGPAVRYLGTDYMSAERVAHRRWCSSRPWNYFYTEKPMIAQIMKDFAQGNPPPNPVAGYTNFASWSVTCEQEDAYRIAGSGNCYIRDPELIGRVTVERR